MSCSMQVFWRQAIMPLRLARSRICRFAENSGLGSLADGFTGLGNLAPGEDMHYAFDVDLTPAIATAVPEPASGAPLAGGRPVVVSRD